MRSRIALAALVTASLIGATSIASAQSQPAPGASSSGNVGPGASDGMKGNMKSGKKMKSGTTGMSGSKKGMGDTESSSGNVGPGTSNSK